MHSSHPKAGLLPSFNCVDVSLCIFTATKCFRIGLFTTTQDSALGNSGAVDKYDQIWNSSPKWPYDMSTSSPVFSSDLQDNVTRCLNSWFATQDLCILGHLWSTEVPMSSRGPWKFLWDQLSVTLHGYVFWQHISSYHDSSWWLLPLALSL